MSDRLPLLINSSASRDDLWAAIEVLTDALEAAEAHVRNHHLEDCMTCMVCTAERDEYLARAERAEADNAALLHMARVAVAAQPDDYWRSAWMEELADADHPGAALLAELERLRAVAEMARRGYAQEASDLRDALDALEARDDD